MKKLTNFKLSKTLWACLGLAVLMGCPLSKVSADIVYSYTNLPSSSLVRGLIVELDVKHAAGIRITDIGVRVAGSGVGQRSYGLYYFAGAHDADVDGTPAHRADLWSQIGSVPLTSIDGQNFLDFTLNLGDAADGTLTLAQGRYTFNFYTQSGVDVNTNGLVARSEPEGQIGTILPPLNGAASAFVDLIAVSTTQSLNGALTTSAPMRTPGQFEMTFIAIPEPGMGILLVGMLFAHCGLTRRRS